MKPPIQDRIHTLIVPLAGSYLLVPSALIAEVINIAPWIPVPRSEKWMLGLLNWRSRPVPVVSYDFFLTSDLPPAGPRSKIVVFYPLPGRKPWDFFGVLTAGEPQPRTFSDAEALSNTVENDNPYAAVTVQLEAFAACIPNLDALKAVFYPGTI
jgi:hypothetical protein